MLAVETDPEVQYRLLAALGTLVSIWISPQQLERIINGIFNT